MFSNYTIQLRTEIYNSFNPILIHVDNNNDSDVIYEILLAVLEKFQDNSKLYKSIISILFLDHYKLNFASLINNTYDEYEQELINYYDNTIKNYDDLLQYIADNPEELVEMINSTIFFTSLDSYEQRQIMNDCKLRHSYLKNISPLHTLDMLCYSFPYTLEYFLQEFEQADHLDKSIDAKIETIISFSHTMAELFIADTKNYSELMLQLIDNYKFMLCNNIIESDNELTKYLDIAANDIVTICNMSYQNESIRNKLLKYYLDFNRTNNNTDNKIYEKLPKNKRDQE